MLANALLAALCSLFIAARAEGTQEVCAPEGCVVGTSMSKFISSDDGSLTSLTPGTFFSPYKPASPLNLSMKYTAVSVTIELPKLPLLFSNASYLGSVTENKTTDDWASAYIPDGMYAPYTPGNALWGAISDRKQITAAGTLGQFTENGCTACHHGICVNSHCKCAPGWGEEECDKCASGYYGPSCLPCPANCTLCDDGLNGSGMCRGASTSPDKCNCVHGSCSNDGGCTCAAGYTTAENSTKLCTECITGFFADVDGNCRACPFACTECELQQGTTNTPSCTACSPTYRVLSNVPATCTPEYTCPWGQYYDTTTNSCERCNAAGCKQCYGPGYSDCLECGVNRGRFGISCRSYDAEGRCGYDGYVYNGVNKKCDACPVGCSSCYIPNLFGPQGLTTTFNPVCSECQDGFVLNNGTCVTTCPSGMYVGGDSQCKLCDKTCTECIGSATYCTTCASGLASNGTCVSSCTSPAIQVNQTCVPCHPDCATCSGPAADQCLTCPASRPVLDTETGGGRCAQVCQKGLYFNTDTRACSACDASCASCVDGSSCTSCLPGQTLVAGQCGAPKCLNGSPFVKSLAVCLAAMVDTKKPRDLTPLAALVFIPLLGLVAWGVVYVRRERRRTREATQTFATKIDNRDVGRRLKALSWTVFDKAFGRDRERAAQPDVERELDEAHSSSVALKPLQERSVVFAPEPPSERSKPDDSREYEYDSPLDISTTTTSSGSDFRPRGPNDSYMHPGSIQRTFGHEDTETLRKKATDVDTDSIDRLPLPRGASAAARVPSSPLESQYTGTSTSTWNAPYAPPTAAGNRPLPTIPSASNLISLSSIASPPAAHQLSTADRSLHTQANGRHDAGGIAVFRAGDTRADGGHLGVAEEHWEAAGSGSVRSARSARSVRTDPESLRELWPAYTPKKTQPGVQGWN